MLNIGKREARFSQAVGDRLGWKASPMLHSAEPLLFCGGDELAVAHERSGGVTMEGIEAENDHPGPKPSAPSSLSHDSNDGFGKRWDPTNTNEADIIEASFRK